MPTRSVLILKRNESQWESFLKACFSDAPAEVCCETQPGQAAAALDRSKPAVLFCDPSFLNLPLVQKLKVRKQTDPSFRLYLLGEPAKFKKDLPCDGVFTETPSEAEFSRRFTETLPMPEKVRILVVDDEEEIGTMVRDYFAGRQSPVFEIECVPNGKEALAAIAKNKPDVIILDIKMPVMDGREFYAKLKASGLEIPVIVFFDSISGEELSEMRKSGNPAVLEKGYKGSSLSAMMFLVKKMVFFSQSK